MLLTNLLTAIVYIFLVIWAYMTLAYLIAGWLKRSDIVDIAWGIGFLVVAISALIFKSNHSLTYLITSTMVGFWALRLSTHIFLRNIAKAEDFRYQAWRQAWGKWFQVRSYFQIFLLQGLLMLLVSMPILVIASMPKHKIDLLVVLGVVVWVTGFVIESTADHQLKIFKSDKANKGKIMRYKLWKYSRHPNYLGEITQWWGLGIIALSFSYGWLGLIGCLTITVLITKVSGIPMLEKHYSANLEYLDYKQHTHALLPLPIKK